MKKLVVLMAVLLTSAIGFTACSVPDIGKIEIVNAGKEAAGGEQEAAPAQGAQENVPAEPEPQESAPLNDTQMQELIDEGIVPKDAAKDEKGNTVYNTQEVGDALKKYAERIDCKTTVIGGNNMIVQVKNLNDVAIPKLTVHVNYPDGEKTYDFCQTAPGSEIVIPVERGSGDLPPAVSANVSVSMNNNQYTDVSSKFGVEESKTDTAYTLTLTNASDRACQKLNVTALFSDDSGVVYALMQSAPETILSGGTTTLTFEFPKSLSEAGTKFKKASYVINEAIG